MSEPILTFSIPYVKAHKGRLKFNTLIDGQYTKHEQRNKQWSRPRRSWTLDFEKDVTDFDELEQFVLAVGGRYRAFYWKWRKTDEYGRQLGGDDQMYLVRFDTDDFDFSFDGLKSKRITLPIVQVMTSE